jgi:hypothetical protein
MTNESPNCIEPNLSGTILDFTPVVPTRKRSNGWSPLAQKRFIYALSVMGSVGAATRAVGMGRSRQDVRGNMAMQWTPR